MHEPFRRLALVIVASAFLAAFHGFTPSASRGADEKAPAPVYSAEETKEFKALAEAAIRAIDAGQEKEAVAKITDLETAWDAREGTLKPRDPATWEVIDKTLDRGISATRGSRTDFKKGKAALEELVQKLTQATKK